MLTDTQKTFFIDEIKKAIEGGKLFCFRCRTVLGGSAVTGMKLDDPDPKVNYKCTNADCDNNKKEGYRTLRGLGIPINDTAVPAEFASIAAPILPANLAGDDIIGDDEVDGEESPENDPESEE